MKSLGHTYGVKQKSGDIFTKSYGLNLSLVIYGSDEMHRPSPRESVPKYIQGLFVCNAPVFNPLLQAICVCDLYRRNKIETHSNNW